MPKKKQGRPVGTTIDPALVVRPCTFNIQDRTKAKIDKLRGTTARGKWLAKIIDEIKP